MKTTLHGKPDRTQTDGSPVNSGNMVLFCTEGGEKIGMGHVMRCLSIAQVMKMRGIKVLFIVNEDKAVLDRVSSEGYPVRSSGFMDNGFIEYIKHCPTLKAVIFDTKRNIAEEIGQFRQIGVKVILIDSSTSAGDADLNIIPSLLPFHVPDNGRHHPQVMTGIEYFPLHRAFLTARQNMTGIPAPRLRVLVTMGGADPNRLTLRVIKAIHGMQGIEMNVVIGPSMEQNRELMDFRNKVNFIVGADVNKMASLMCEADVAITAFGITLYELAYMGVPSVVIANYREDKEDMAAFDKQGAGITLGYFEEVTDLDIRDAVALFLQNNDMSQHMSRNGRTLIDGRGTERIVNIIENLCGTSNACLHR